LLRSLAPALALLALWPGIATWLPAALYG